MVMKRTCNVDIDVGMNILETLKDDEGRKIAKRNFDFVFECKHLMKVEEFGDPGNEHWYDSSYQSLYGIIMPRSIPDIASNCTLKYLKS